MLPVEMTDADCHLGRILLPLGDKPPEYCGESYLVEISFQGFLQRIILIRFTEMLELFQREGSRILGPESSLAQEMRSKQSMNIRLSLLFFPVDTK